MENKIVQKHMGMKAKNRIVNFFIYSILIVMCVVWVLPFCGILLESFRTESTGQVGYIIPKQWGFDNYKRLFDVAQYNSNFNYLRWYGNTAIIALFSSVIQTKQVTIHNFLIVSLTKRLTKTVSSVIVYLV